jgi:hypothetical protein
MNQISDHLHHLIHEYYNIAGKDQSCGCHITVDSYSSTGHFTTSINVNKLSVHSKYEWARWQLSILSKAKRKYY